MNKKSKQIVLAFLILIIFGLLAVFVFDINCIFKSLFGIPCPGCGLTRAFKEVFHGNLLKAEEYNLLSIPILLFLLLCLALIIFDLFKKTNRTEVLLQKLSKYYKLIIIIVIINWIINIMRGV